MVLDECLAHPAEEAAARQSMARTLRWACRGRDRFLALRDRLVPGVTVTNPGQAQFGIVQGSVFPHLRAESARETVAIGFEAYAIGGLSVGEPSEVMYDMVDRPLCACRRIAHAISWAPAHRRT
jgi:queuine tRNA-ribosyltransferase